MSINFFTTCVNYSDYFSYCLKFNHYLFDKIYVATSTTDIDTQNLCNQYKNIHTEITDVFFENGAPFNKAKGLNSILKYIVPKSQNWNLIGDADCIYPKNLKEIIFSLNNKDNLYGFARIICHNHQDVISFIENKQIFHTKEESIINGYCQIFNSSSKFLDQKNIKYDETCLAANTSDWRFKKYWPKQNRTLLPEYILHLGEVEKNWKGRITEPWT